MNRSPRRIAICVYLASLKHANNSQIIDEQFFYAHYYLCSPASPEADGPEFLKTKSRAIAHKQFMGNHFTRITICVYTLFLEAGGPEFLKTKSRHRAQITYGQQPTRITILVYAFFLEAGDPELRKTKARDTNAQTLYKQPFQAYYYVFTRFS